jgi:hypothetical protein
MSVSETHVGVVDGESVPHSGMHTAGLRALNCLSAVFSVTCVPGKRWLVRSAVCYATHSMTAVWCLGSGLPACPCSAKPCICRAPPARVPCRTLAVQPLRHLPGKPALPLRPGRLRGGPLPILRQVGH